MPKRIAVIGAGGSGLTAVKSCLEGGLDVVCYEKYDDIGGLWIYREKDADGHPSVMRSTVINSSKEMSAFSDFPPPDHFPNFMHNRYMREYLVMYAKHFDVVQHVRLRHEVLKVSPTSDYEQTGRWRVLVKDIVEEKELDEVFDGVMMCAGHHVYPIVPDLPGLSDFQGKKQHTHSLKTADGMEEKEVLVVGCGNSGVDAAVEVGSVAKQVYISTRRGFWLIGRTYKHGLPLDSIVNRRHFQTFYPMAVANYLLEQIATNKMDHKAYNIKPEHPIIANHPTVNDHLPNRILSGTVQIKSNVNRFTKHGVIFENEDREYPLDAVILATGYSYKVPFLDSDLVKVDDNTCDLYKLVFPPKLRHPTLAFIGIIQPIGAIFPISELQSRWYVQVMKGNCKLPSASEMVEEIRKRQEIIGKQFIKAVRHLTEVVWIEYMDEIASKIGAKPNFLRLLWSDPSMFFNCFFGPCLPYQFRLTGPHQWSEARQTILTCSKRIQAPLNTRKGFKREYSRQDQKLRKPQLWGLLLIPFFMYFLLFVM